MARRVLSETIYKADTIFEADAYFEGDAEVSTVDGHIRSANGDIRTANGDVVATNGDVRSTNGDIRTINGRVKGPVVEAAFFESDILIVSNRTITAGKNAMTPGPVTIDDGVTITVPDGSTWTVV